MWRRVRKGHLIFYQADEFNASGIAVQGFTTKLGGAGRYGGPNLGLHVGDDPDAVIENRRAVCEALGSKLGDLVAGEQVHGTEVRRVFAHHRGSGALSYSTALLRTDGMITSANGCLLSVFVADCVPIFLFDPATPAGGAPPDGLPSERWMP